MYAFISTPLFKSYKGFRICKDCLKKIYFFMLPFDLTVLIIGISCLLKSECFQCCSKTLSLCKPTYWRPGKHTNTHFHTQTHTQTRSVRMRKAGQQSILQRPLSSMNQIAFWMTLRNEGGTLNGNELYDLFVRCIFLYVYIFSDSSLLLFLLAFSFFFSTFNLSGQVQYNSLTETRDHIFNLTYPNDEH